MNLNPYLSFNGQCEAAFKSYEKLLGGKITFMQTWGDSPAAEMMPAEARGSIMHATLTFGDAILMGADSPPDQYEQPRGMDVMLHYDDPSEGERIFQGLSEGGNVVMPFAPTFFTKGFGICVDRFGTPWMVHCGQIQG